MQYLARRIQNFLRQGGAAPLQPPPHCLTQALGLLASLAVVWAPNVENFPKPLQGACKNTSYTYIVRLKQGVNKLSILDRQMQKKS